MTPIELTVNGAEGTVFPEAPDHQNQPAAAIGRFRCEDAAAGCALLDKASAVARDLGKTALLGPLDGNTWYKYRLQTWSDGSPAFPLEPTNPPQDLTAFRDAGFVEAARYYSSRKSAKGLSQQRPRRLKGWRAVKWDGQDQDALLAEIHAIASVTFDKNPYYAPISAQAFGDLYRPVLTQLDPGFVWQARCEKTGRLGAFLFTIPDMAATHGPRLIIKTYATVIRGGGSLLYHAACAEADQNGFEEIIHALMHEENDSNKFFGQDPASHLRRYALMAKHLDA